MNRRPRLLLGKRVRKLRLEMNLSQEQLADVTGLHRTYIGAVERGERNISLDNIIRLARGLEITASALVHGIEK
jgi:transcriptional regulator with XRE-family HTH domain